MASIGSVSRESSPLKSSTARPAQSTASTNSPNVAIWYGPPSGRFRSQMHELFLVAAPPVLQGHPDSCGDQLRAELQLVSPLDHIGISSAAGSSSQGLQFSVADYRCPACSGVFPADESGGRSSSLTLDRSSTRVCSGCVQCPRCGGPAAALCSKSMEAWLMCPACDWRTPRYASAAALDSALSEQISKGPAVMTHSVKKKFADVKKRLVAAEECVTMFSASAYDKMGMGQDGSVQCITREVRLAQLDRTLEECRRQITVVTVLNNGNQHRDDPASSSREAEASSPTRDTQTAIVLAPRAPDLIVSLKEPISRSLLAAKHTATIFSLSSNSISTLLAQSCFTGSQQNMQDSPPTSTLKLARMPLSPRIGVCFQKDSTKGRQATAAWLSFMFPPETHLNDVHISSTLQLAATTGRGSKTSVLTSSAARWLPLLSMASSAIPQSSSVGDADSSQAAVVTRRHFFWLTNINDHVVVRVMKLGLRRSSGSSACSSSLAGEIVNPPTASPADDAPPNLWCGVSLEPLVGQSAARGKQQRDHVDVANLLAIAESSLGLEECGHRLLFYVDAPMNKRRQVLTFDIEVETQLTAGTSAGGSLAQSSSAAISRRESSLIVSSSSASASNFGAAWPGCSFVRYVAYVVIDG